jgi:hypothetical protein
MILTRATVAKVFAGQIEFWDDEAISLRNPQLALPHERIIGIVKAKKGGTTASFTKALHMFDATLFTDYGDIVEWPESFVQLTSGSIAESVLLTPYSISFVLLQDALVGNVCFTDMSNLARERRNDYSGITLLHTRNGILEPDIASAQLRTGSRRCAPSFIAALRGLGVGTCTFQHIIYENYFFSESTILVVLSHRGRRVFFRWFALSS